jgi:NitT/TauT family transport system ATP-binding protein
LILLIIIKKGTWTPTAWRSGVASPNLILQLVAQSLMSNLNPTIILITHDSREAAYLANDIYIMSSNPGRVKEHITVNFSSKNNLKESKEYLDLVSYIDNII